MRLTPFCMLAVMAAWSPRAAAVVIDFEEFDLSANSPLSVGPTLAFPNVGNSGVNVTIVGGQPNLRIFDLTASGESQALADSVTFGTDAVATTILFDQPVANFQLRAGDLGTDEDTPLTITAYDVGDNVLGSDSEIWVLSQAPPFVPLSVNATGIRKVVYSSGGMFPNSTFIDDLSFTPVPEPGAYALLGAVAAGAGVLRGRRAAWGRSQKKS